MELRTDAFEERTRERDPTPFLCNYMMAMCRGTVRLYLKSFRNGT